MRRPICLVKKLYICFLLKFVLGAERNHDRPVWGWACLNGKCTKTENKLEGEPNSSLEVCKMFCNDNGVLWPKPNGKVDLGNFLSKINIDNIVIESKSGGQSDNLVRAAGERFKNLVKFVIPEGVIPKTNGESLTLVINLINDRPDVTELSLDVKETYSLRVAAVSQDRINATISAPTFFGLRHGLETLSQLIVYDDIRNHILMVRDVKIDDKPVYPYRGILLDTARNYFPIDSIKRTIDAMGAVKLNTFHWHITDSQSFPFVSERRPNLSKYGAYSSSKVYTKKAISEIVQYGLERGVRVLPEFDAPAHVGEGWQNTNLTVCFNAEPWGSYCPEPPCGHLNPTKSEVYDVLEDIYKDMADAFHPDLFHMGGDEVQESCWNTSESIQQFMLDNNWGLSKSSYLQLWNYFQENAKIRAYKAFGKILPLILWTSTLTDFNHIQEFLNKDDYIIQVWTTGDDPQIMGLLGRGYKLIMSNYDALYLDCGFGALMGTGNNWCSPYIGWQKVYNNSPALMAGKYKHQILGGEAALWSEQVDSASMDGRLWPRAAAFAERMWAEPTTTWQDAEKRLLNVRERLVRMGIQSESIQPEWCYQNEGKCVL